MDSYDHDFNDETDEENICKVCGCLLPWHTIANDDEKLCHTHGGRE